MIPAMPALLPAPNFDSGAAYPEVNSMRTALTAGDWPTARRILASLDWSGISLLTGVAGELEGIEPLLRSVVARQPGDPFATTLLASHLIRTGWRVRSAYRAQHVSREQFDQFHAYLRRAERILIDTTARHPGFVAAGTLRVTSARGLELGQSEARRRYDQLAKYHPHHRPAQSSLLQKLCPKWSGSWEATHSFALECMRTAPPGSHNPVLVVEGHLEYALDQDDTEQAAGYLRGPQVRQELHEAAQRSVWHPGFRHEHGWVAVRSTFALAFSLMEEWAAAAGQFTALGHLADESMFGYLGDQAEQFQKYRAEAYAKGGPR